MPKTFVDWCTVLGFVLALWLILAKPRAYIERSVLNWLATLTRERTEERIRQLEEISSKSELLPLLTAFEDMVLRGLSGIFVFLTMISAIAAFACLIIFIPPGTEISSKELLRLVLLTLLLAIIVLLGMGIGRAIDTFREARSQVYRDMINKSIADLRARLN
jgi:hypothetical protein